MTVTEQILQSIATFRWQYGLKPQSLFVGSGVYTQLLVENHPHIDGMWAQLDLSLSSEKIELRRAAPAPARTIWGDLENNYITNRTIYQWAAEVNRYGAAAPVAVDPAATPEPTEDPL